MACKVLILPAIGMDLDRKEKNRIFEWHRVKN